MALYHILSIDGGGIRGVLTARLLERLEAARPGFLSRVDLFAGTSTGGILALGLASGMTPQQCLELYELKGSVVFADSLLDDLRDLGNAVGAEYSNRNLKEELFEQFGYLTLGDLPKKVLVSAVDLDNDPDDLYEIRTWKVKFFHNYPGEDSDGAERVSDVALRTSAAPTFFPIYQGYIDGGVVVNSPAMCALAQALDADTGGQQLKDVVLLSLSTGRNPKFLTQQDADWGWVQWAQHLIELMLGEGNAGLSDYQCRRLLKSRYHRLNPVIPRPVSLDDVEAIPLLKQVADEADLGPTLSWLDENGWLSAEQ